MKHWKPSALALSRTDPGIGQHTLRPGNGAMWTGSSDDIDKALYVTGAEEPTAVAPFLLDNMQQDYRKNVQGRDHLVFPGGDTYYFKDHVVPRPQVDAPKRDFVPQFHELEGEKRLTFGAQRAVRTRGVSGQLPTRDYFGHFRPLGGFHGKRD